MGIFEDLHRDRVCGSLAMYDRMISKGRLTALYKENGAIRLTAATGQPVEIGGVSVGTVEDAHLALLREYWDPEDIARQVGAVPTG